ncbi:MAG: VWA domain-containing protein, partial [Thermoplasmata archaeon]|nr:VWA domain-containing protein [Thermoplasmata archaeon]
MAIKTKKIDAGFILLAMLLILSGFVVLMSNTSGEVTEDLKINYEPQARSTNPARLEISKSVGHNQIFVKDSGLNPEKTRVTITVKGVGYPGVEYNPQDTVFIMDNSDSMDESDNEFKRIEALKLYLETMLPPDDRAAVIKFSRDAELINDHHLTSNYTQIIDDLPALWHTSGLTNLGAAVALANEELIQYSDTDKILVEILLTDGRPEPPENNVTMDTINEAIDNKIKIYTVGLGEDHDAKLLRWIANMTGGKYYYAREAEDLIIIYNEISNQFHNYTAGSDPDITDSDPMVRDVLPYWVEVEQGSFSIEPDYFGAFLGDTTRIEWNISRIAIGETWTVSY